MAANVAKGTVLQLAAGVHLAQAKSPMCKAWRAAAKTWCDDYNKHKDAVAKNKADPVNNPHPGKMNRGSFNDRLFAAGTDPKVMGGKLMDGIRREVPIGASRGSGAFTMTEIAGRLGGSVGGVLASTAGVIYAGATAGLSMAGGGFDFARQSMRDTFGPLKDAGYSAFYPDGLTKNGTAIEIKGPGDPSNLNQAKKYAKTAPSGKCVVVSHLTCDTEGVCTPKGQCKRK